MFIKQGIHRIHSTNGHELYSMGMYVIAAIVAIDMLAYSKAIELGQERFCKVWYLLRFYS